MTDLTAVPKITCYADTDLVHSAYATTGLVELAEAGEIDLEFRLVRDGLTRYRGPFTMLVEVNGRLVCLDFHDANTYVCRASLDRCEAYYKVNWSAGGLAALDAAERRKVRPLGPYFPCRPSRDRSLRWRVVGNTLAHVRHRAAHLRGAKSLTRWMREVKHTWLGRAHRYRGRLTWRAYENPPGDGTSAPAAPLVFFHPTCREEREETSQRVNQARAELIVGLRDALGPAFAGGFRRSPLAEAKYAAALEDRPYSHADYVRLLHTAPIAIYTNGLVGCFSWRLIETFAAGRAIVSEPLVNDPGYPLGEGIVQCITSASMFDKVLALVPDTERLRAMQEATWQTYEERMQPAARMHALVEELIDRPHVTGANVLSAV